MAKARMKIICANCGAEFRHTRDCWNAADREDYIAWAEQNITLCPSCWRRQEAKRIISEAVEKGDAVVERMLYKDYKNEWKECRTVPDTYDAETKTIEVCISKLDRAWHDTLEELPPEVKNDEKFMHDWKLHFRSLVTHRPVIAEDAAPEWAVKVAEIVNTIYGC